MSELGPARVSPGAAGGETDEPTRVLLQANALPNGVDLAALERWLEELVRALQPDRGDLIVRLTDEEEMRRLNETYRRRRGSTDVLSFPGEPTPEGEHLGDVVIAVPVAVRQAEEANLPLAVEIRRLALHGLLHCLGYDHETDAGEMEALEARLREQWIGEGP